MAGTNPYPERDGNCFRLLPGADAFLPVMELAIHRAKHFVLFEQYLLNSGVVAGRFIDAFAACVQRGVSVYMFIDHFGARGLSSSDRFRITQAGISMLFYNPAYLSHFFRGLPRNHSKMLLIDGKVAFTGGAGITDDYEPGASGQAWHDVIVEMQGPVVGDWQDRFVRLWRQWDGDITLPETAPEQAGKQRGQLMLSQRGLRKYIRKSLLARIRQSRKRVWLGTAYLLPGRTMLRALRAASRRGADVRLLVPGKINDHPTVYHAGQRYYHYLLRHGIRIFEYQPAFMHAKIYLYDGYCSVGSCNMDRWGLRWNLEANLESDDQKLCAEVESFFGEGFGHAREITLETWLSRPLEHRLREWFLGYLDLMIERYGAFREIRKGKSSRKNER